MDQHPRALSGGVTPPNNDSPQTQLLAQQVSNLLTTIDFKSRLVRLATIGGPRFAKKVQTHIKELDTVSVGIQQKIGGSHE